MPAGRADTIEIDFVPLGDEAGRRGTLFVENASGYLEKPVAGPALEMMMMFLAGSFIGHTFLEGVDLLEPPCFDQDFEIAIDGGQVEGSDFEASRFQNFMDAERSVDVSENFLDSGSLTRFSFHSVFRKISS
jgi:hypothetical protein